MPDKPCSAASERNRHPILEVLRSHFADRTRVLEIGSGTGQHAVHFAAHLPHLQWQCTDRQPYLGGIAQWLAEAALPNTPLPWSLDVNDAHWPTARFDAVYSANTLHIMSWTEVQRMFERLPQMLLPHAKLVVYGPFRRAGAHTSDSNAAFDQQLRSQSPQMGIRDLEAVHELAKAIGLLPQADIAMPANNACVIWQRSA